MILIHFTAIISGSLIRIAASGMFLARRMRQSAYAVFEVVTVNCHLISRAREGPFVPILDFWTISEPVKDSIGQNDTLHKNEILSLLRQTPPANYGRSENSWAYRPGMVTKPPSHNCRPSSYVKRFALSCAVLQ